MAPVHLAFCAASMAVWAVRTDFSSFSAVLCPGRSFCMSAKSAPAAANSHRSRCNRPLGMQAVRDTVAEHENTHSKRTGVTASMRSVLRFVSHGGDAQQWGLSRQTAL